MRNYNLAFSRWWELCILLLLLLFRGQNFWKKEKSAKNLWFWASFMARFWGFRLYIYSSFLQQLVKNIEGWASCYWWWPFLVPSCYGMLATWVTSWKCRKKRHWVSLPSWWYTLKEWVPHDPFSTHMCTLHSLTLSSKICILFGVLELSIKSPCLPKAFSFAPYPFFQWYLLQSKEIWVW